MGEMNTVEKEYLYWLCQVPGLGAVKIRKLWKQFGSFKEIYNIEEKYFEEADFLTCRDVEKILGCKKYFNHAVQQYHSLNQRGIQFITPLDENYPKRLRNIYDMPMGLYIKGELPDEDKPAVAIVGARACTNYGWEIGRLMGKALAREGVQIISGMAAGIDSAGHQGALEAKEEEMQDNQPYGCCQNDFRHTDCRQKAGKTFAVLGSGVDYCYPVENYNLYCRIEESGGLISEYPLGGKPKPMNFPIRNRIISGLSDAVLVIEAKEKSGSLITVELALEQGREVFALPGRITDPLSRGCNELIRQGANVLTSPNEVLEFLGLKIDKILRVGEKNRKGLAKKEKMVYSCLDLQPRHIDEIVSRSGLTVSQCMSILLDLELGDFIVQTAGQYYGKKL